MPKWMSVAHRMARFGIEMEANKKLHFTPPACVRVTMLRTLAQPLSKFHPSNFNVFFVVVP